VRRTIALTIAGLATAASLAPLPAASAVCWPDLSPVGGPACPNLCPGVVIAVVDRVSPGFIRCLA
jgi:hypothetical protein